ncbi:MAG: putative membrane protein YfcA, partial [Janthinobacterium sp.]
FSGGTLAGMIAGRLVATRLSGPLLQRGFAIVSALVAVALLVKALR